jgi:predicted nucleic acid-binding protein
MTRVAFDTNVLLYPALEPGSPKSAIARDLITKAGPLAVVPVQVLGEYLRKFQKPKAPPFETGVAVVKRIQTTMQTPPTSPEVMLAASDLAQQHKFQIWDAVIIAASVEAGARVLFSEDMQDGRTVGGLRILNPFDASNAADVAALFAP